MRTNITQNLIFKGLNGQFKIVAATQYITRIKDSTKNVNILYHMKTLGLNAHMEGWWEKRQTKEETTHG